jgi:inhibitor of the pro-sigma K processing machinery
MAEMMRSVWLWMFFGSLVGIFIVMVRSRHRWKVISALALNVTVALVLLYLMGLAEPYIHFRLPMNPVTVATVTVLGVPGLAMLAGLKLLVVV